MTFRLSDDSFPYGWPGWVCYFTIKNNRPVQMHTRDNMREALKKNQKIYAVWPGQWRSDMFLVDIDKLREALGPSCMPPAPPPDPVPTHTVSAGKCYTTVVFTEQELKKLPVDDYWDWRIACPECGRERISVNDPTTRTQPFHKGPKKRLYKLRVHPVGPDGSWAELGGRPRCPRVRNDGQPCKSIIGHYYDATCASHATPEERALAHRRGREARHAAGIQTWATSTKAAPSPTGSN